MKGERVKMAASERETGRRRTPIIDTALETYSEPCFFDGTPPSTNCVTDTH